MTVTSFNVPELPFAEAAAQQQRQVESTAVKPSQQPQQVLPEIKHPNPDGRPVDDEGYPVLFCGKAGVIPKSVFGRRRDLLVPRGADLKSIPVGSDLASLFGREP